MKARSDIDAQIVRYTRFLAAKDKSNHLVADFLYVFLMKLELNSFHSGKANDWRNRKRVVLDLFSEANENSTRIRTNTPHNRPHRRHHMLSHTQQNTTSHTHTTTHGEGCM